MQVTPLFQEPLELPTEVMPKIKAAIMMCIAVVQLLNTRSLVQSYLNSGLRQWHSMKHGPPAGAAGTKTGEVIAFKLRVVNTLVVKVRQLSLSWSWHLDRDGTSSITPLLQPTCHSSLLMGIYNMSAAMLVPYVSNIKLSDSRQLTWAWKLLSQVAIQCVAPSIILTGCSIIILQHSDDGKSGILTSGNTSADILQIPISFWVCIADFCGWWTCTCWFLYGASFLTFIKSHLLLA